MKWLRNAYIQFNAYILSFRRGTLVTGRFAFCPPPNPHRKKKKNITILLIGV